MQQRAKPRPRRGRCQNVKADEYALAVLVRGRKLSEFWKPVLAPGSARV